MSTDPEEPAPSSDGDRFETFTDDDLYQLERLTRRLPPVIVDAHTHLYRDRDVQAVAREYLSLPVMTFASHAVAEATRVRDRLWPGRGIRSLRMPMPLAGVPFQVANEFVTAAASRDGDYAAVVADPRQPRRWQTLLLRAPVRAVKFHARAHQPPAETLTDMVTASVLRILADAGLCAIVHLPAPIGECATDLQRLAESVPDTPIVLAHLGSARPGNASDAGALRRLSDFASIHYDTSLVLSPELLLCALAEVGHDRLLYGSDEPLSLIRAAEYQHPLKGKQWTSSLPYRWLDATDRATFAHHAAHEQLLHVRQIQALLDAIDASYNSEQSRDVITAVFSANARRLFTITTGDITAGEGQP